MSKLSIIEFTNEDRKECIEYAKNAIRAYGSNGMKNQSSRLKNLWFGKLGEIIFHKAFGDKLVESKEEILGDPKGGKYDGGFDFVSKRTGTTYDVKTIDYTYRKLAYKGSTADKIAIVVIKPEENKATILAPIKREIVETHEWNNYISLEDLNINLREINW